MEDGLKHSHHHKTETLGLEEVDRHKESEREAALSFILRNKVVGRDHASTLLGYWQKSVRQSERYDEHGQVKILVDKLKQDMDGLKKLRLELKMNRQDPAVADQVPALQQLIRMLDLIFEKLEKRWWMLRRRAWAYIATLNTAFPKKHLLHEKKKGKDKVQEAAVAARKKKD
jgi:hypothetical protein